MKAIALLLLSVSMAWANAPVSKPTQIMVGEPTSSLTRAQANAAAKAFAVTLKGAAVASFDDAYTGRFSPMLPRNAVYVVEPVEYAAIKPFDLIVYIGPDKKLHPRKVLAKGADRVVVGFESSSETAEIAPEWCVGRIIAHFLFDPHAS